MNTVSQPRCGVSALLTEADARSGSNGGGGEANDAAAAAFAPVPKLGLVPVLGPVPNRKPTPPPVTAAGVAVAAAGAKENPVADTGAV